MGRFKICLAIDKEHRVLTARSAHGVSFGFLQPDLQFLLRDQAVLTFILLRPGLLAPIVKLLAGDPSGLDPRKAPFVFLAVSLESVIVCLPERPLLQSADVAAALLTFRNRPLAILRADPPGLRKPAAAVLAAMQKGGDSCWGEVMKYSYLCGFSLQYAMFTASQKQLARYSLVKIIVRFPIPIHVYLQLACTFQGKITYLIITILVKS